MPSIWVGKRPPPRKPWTWAWELLHHRAAVGSMCCLGGLALILLAVIVLSLKGSSSYTSSDCLVIEKTTEDGNCTLSVNVESCSSDGLISQQSAGVNLPCLDTGGFDIGSNLSCYAPKSCLPEEPIFMMSSDPNYEQTTCRLLSAPFGDGNCSVKTYNYVCNETVVIREQTVGTPLSCSALNATNATVDLNMTCYMDSGCLQPQAFSDNPDPATWRDPTSTDIIILLCCAALIPFLALSIMLCKQNLLKISRFRELPY
eukprot:TRINITY_DN30870_c0_g1_i1.p1 TRINITY_DN30870_c0_g1~~TRINITY_DN30870_c0_g1_i1.p1  ORF type:complete len:277 (+),score=38.08 TRINITY_DN30870_c0_g1_i1:58-831(+)